MDLNIQYSGFREIDEEAFDLVKVNVNKHSRRLLELCENPGILHIDLKRVHKREKSEIYEVHAKIVDNGRVYASQSTDRNLLAAVDMVLERLKNEMD